MLYFNSHKRLMTLDILTTESCDSQKELNSIYDISFPVWGNGRGCLTRYMGAWSNWIAHQPFKLAGTGSNPVVPTYGDEMVSTCGREPPKIQADFNTYVSDGIAELEKMLTNETVEMVA